MAPDSRLAVEVRFSARGFAAFPVDIKPRDSHTMVPVLYKVDSGASCTTISRKRLNTLGYDDAWIVRTGRLLEANRRPLVASGVPLDGCYEIILSEIRIGGWVGYNWPFLTCLNDKVAFNTLLGTDSMQFFNWDFNYESGVCRFGLISGKRKVLFNQAEQSIHSLETGRDEGAKEGYTYA